MLYIIHRTRRNSQALSTCIVYTHLCVHTLGKTCLKDLGLKGLSMYMRNARNLIRYIFGIFRIFFSHWRPSQLEKSSVSDVTSTWRFNKQDWAVGLISLLSISPVLASFPVLRSEEGKHRKEMRNSKSTIRRTRRLSGKDLRKTGKQG